MDQPNPAIHNGGGGHIHNDQQQQQQQHMDMLNGLQAQMANQQNQPNSYPNNYMPHPGGPPQQQPYWPMGHNEMPSTSTAANGYGGNRMVNGGGRPMGPAFLPNPHYFPSPEQMSMPGAVSSPSVSSSDQQYQGMPGGTAGSPLKNGVPFSPTYNPMVNGGARNAFVFSTEMANRAVTEVSNKRYESMVHWHMANAGGAVQPSTSTANTMGMPCRSPLDGAYGVVGSPSPAGLAPGTNGRGTKRKASANMTNPDQHQSPSPHHLPVLSNGNQYIWLTTTLVLCLMQL
uniref:Uncharacterized protein n=1 Tax=Ditylenchus dipsaci TaxID=166011 RepID=A0A915DC74_9BILA